jgi:hypothetical protein
MADIGETVLWLPGIALTLACVTGSVLVPRRSPGGSKPSRSWIGTLARLGLWGFPAGILADVQYRLYQLGHSMSPGAAFRQPPFTPPVVGGAQVSSNVHTSSWPGGAVMLLVAAAFLMTFGISLYRFAKQMMGAGDVAQAEEIEPSGPGPGPGSGPAAAFERVEAIG